jgi:hypothetical protein
MYDEYVKEPKSLDTLTLEQVSERIHSTNERTTRRWLEECGIKVYRFARKSFVYQVEVESEIDKPFVLHLRNHHPDKWKERYRDVVKDLAVYNLLVSKIEDIASELFG